MATKRMIETEIWQDEFFTSLPIFDRLLWVGLITGCSDDQGRLQDVPAIIRSKVFPTEDIKLSDIENSLSRYCTAGKIARYTVDGKRLIQIVKWWKHQTPRWAARSLYPAPEGWIDRVRCHTTGNRIDEDNWDSIGGYIANCITPNTILYVNGNGEVNVKDDVKQFDVIFSHLDSMIGCPLGGNSDVDTAEVMLKEYGEERFTRAAAWAKEQTISPMRTALKSMNTALSHGGFHDEKTKERFAVADAPEIR